jgi:hypothetical protein
MLIPENEEEVLRALDAEMSGRGNGIKAAERLDIEYRYLRSIRAGSRRMNQDLAAKLGFELRWVRK